MASAGSVRLRGFDELRAVLGDDLIGDPARAMLWTGAELARDKGADLAPGRHLGRSIQVSVDKKPVPGWGKASTKEFHAPFLEYGTKPHFPPPDAFSSGPIGFAIAKSIARKGTKKYPFMGPASEALSRATDALLAKMFGDVKRKFER